MAFDYAKQARSRVISQYRDDSKLMALLQGFGDLAFTKFEYAADVLRLIYSIDDMAGAQLDLIGRILVLPRPAVTNTSLVFFGYAGTPGAVGYNVAPYYDYDSAADVLVPLPDPYYQKILKAKAAQNTTDCSTDSVIEIVELVTEDPAVTLTNNLDMTFSIVLSQTPDQLTTLLLNNVPFVPAPPGVQYTGWSSP